MLFPRHPTRIHTANLEYLYPEMKFPETSAISILEEIRPYAVMCAYGTLASAGAVIFFHRKTLWSSLQRAIGRSLAALFFAFLLAAGSLGAAVAAISLYVAWGPLAQKLAVSHCVSFAQKAALPLAGTLIIAAGIFVGSRLSSVWGRLQGLAGQYQLIWVRR